MTYDEQVQYYADLLIIRFRGKPRAQATVQSMAREAMMDNLPLQVRDAFDVNTAAGAQLDVIGKYAGVKRNILTFTGGADLGDSDYRTLIKLAIVRNNSVASLKAIDDLLADYLGNALTVFDHQDMTMGYFFNASFGSVELAEAFVKLGMLPKPMGVQLSSLIYAGNLTNLFGWGSYLAPPFQVHGFNSYATYDSANPWLSYANAISI